MTPAARRGYPLAVLLAGLLAAAVVVPLAGRGRREDRAEADRRVASLAAAAIAVRADALARAVRGPALAFELGALTAEEATGILRLSYAQNDGVSAVTLLERGGNPVTLRDRAGNSVTLPAVFLPRATGGDHPIESLEDLERFSREIPLAEALARGRAVRGPYASVRGDGARLAVAEAVPVAEGTSTWVLAAEVDAERLLRGVALGAGDGEVALVTPHVTVGTFARLPEDGRAALRAAARRAHTLREPAVLAGRTWRAAIARAPGDLGGVVAVAWTGDDDWARRARAGELALGVIIVTIIGSLAAALFVALREASRPVVAGAPDDGADGSGGSSGLGVAQEARVLGAVVKELANPIAATSAAARLLGAEPGRGRVVEALQRSALRVERAFRRVSRLARAGEESARTAVDLGAAVRREVAAMRTEVDQAGQSLVLGGAAADDAGEAVLAHANADDVALLVQALLDGAQQLAPAGTAITVAVRRATSEGAAAVELVVGDRGPLRARERLALMDVAEGTRTDTAAPVLAWALAARIAQDHNGSVDMRDDESGAVEAVVTLEPGTAPASR